jgi:hypothetical protein
METVACLKVVLNNVFSQFPGIANKYLVLSLVLVNQALPSVTKWNDFKCGSDIIDLKVNNAERYQTTPLLYIYRTFNDAVLS